MSDQTTVKGVSGEDRSDYTKAESRAIQRRSQRLLLSLLKPLKWRVLLVAVVVVAQTGVRVLGPALLGIGLNVALPAARDEAEWGPVWLVTGAYVATAIAGAAVCRETSSVVPFAFIRETVRPFMDSTYLAAEAVARRDTCVGFAHQQHRR